MLYKLMNNDVVRPLFKNSSIAHELTARVVSLVLKIDYNEIYNNMEFISEDKLFKTETVDGRTDLMLEIGKYYICIKKIFDKQIYNCFLEIFVIQVAKTNNYKYIEKFKQIIIEKYDHFKSNEFIYEVGLMEKELGIPESDLITKYYISLENLKNMECDSIRYEKNALKRILYMFVCEEDKLEEIYKGDIFMESVIDIAKTIANKKKIPLYLVESKIG